MGGGSPPYESGRPIRGRGGGHLRPPSGGGGVALEILGEPRGEGALLHPVPRIQEELRRLPRTLGLSGGEERPGAVVSDLVAVLLLRRGAGGARFVDAAAHQREVGSPGLLVLRGGVRSTL